MVNAVIYSLLYISVQFATHVRTSNLIWCLAVTHYTEKRKALLNHWANKPTNAHKTPSRFRQHFVNAFQSFYNQVITSPSSSMLVSRAMVRWRSTLERTWIDIRPVHHKKTKKQTSSIGYFNVPMLFCLYFHNMILLLYWWFLIINTNWDTLIGQLSYDLWCDIID